MRVSQLLPSLHQPVDFEAPELLERAARQALETLGTALEAKQDCLRALRASHRTPTLTRNAPNLIAINRPAQHPLRNSHQQ